MFDLYAHFRMQKEPADKELNAWHNEMKDLATSELPYICKQIKKESDSLPRNITKAFYRWHMEYINSDKSRRLNNQFKSTFCATCEGAGIFWKELEPQPPYQKLTTYCFRCPDCSNHLRHCGPDVLPVWDESRYNERYYVR